MRFIATTAGYTSEQPGRTTDDQPACPRPPAGLQLGGKRAASNARESQQREQCNANARARGAAQSQQSNSEAAGAVRCSLAAGGERIPHLWVHPPRAPAPTPLGGAFAGTSASASALFLFLLFRSLNCHSRPGPLAHSSARCALLLRERASEGERASEMRESERDARQPAPLAPLAHLAPLAPPRAPPRPSRPWPRLAPPRPWPTSPLPPLALTRRPHPTRVARVFVALTPSRPATLAVTVMSRSCLDRD
jgi:hypothetical protein